MLYQTVRVGEFTVYTVELITVELVTVELVTVKAVTGHW